MIPRTYPSSVSPITGRTQMVVYFLSSITGLQRWVDYIPVKWASSATAAIIENSTDTNGALNVDALSSTTGKQAWVDYVPVYADTSATDSWQVSGVGFLPVNSSGTPLNLFSASEQGAWYDPSDFNSYMATGSELVVNGGFDTNLSGWGQTGGSAWSWESGKAKLTGDGSAQDLFHQSTILTIGRWYRVSFDVSSTGGSIGVTNTGVVIASGSSGTVTTEFQATAGYLGFKRVSGTVTGTIDNISVKELTSISAATMYQDSAGATPVTAVGQPVGLMLDKRLGAVRGAELWSDASVSFNSESSRVGANTYRIYSSAGVDSSVSVSGVTTIGNWYEVAFNVDSVTTAGSGLRVGATTGPIVAATTGLKRVIFQADAGSALIKRAGGVTDIQISNVSWKSLTGNHRTQATAASRPTLSARVNKLSSPNANPANTSTLTKTGDAAAVLSVVSDSAALAAAGLSSICTSGNVYKLDNTAGVAEAFANFSGTPGNLTGNTFSVYSRGSGQSRAGVAASFNTGQIALTADYSRKTTNGLPTATSSLAYVGAQPGAVVYFILFDLRDDADNIHRSPQVVTSATDYDTTGFPLYLSYDGVDDGMATASVDFSGTDKMTVWAGVHKASDAAAGCVVELSVNPGANAGSFGVLAPGSASNNYGVRSGGTASVAAVATATAPHSAVLGMTADIAGDSLSIRVNGSIASTVATDQGTGNFGNYPLYFGRRAGTSNPFNGREYQSIILGRAATASEVSAMERFIASKSGISL